MKVKELGVEGLYGISVNPHVDGRGKLQRVWDTLPELANFSLVQASHVANPHKGTLRGIHFQDGPSSETKVVQCVSGIVFDVVIDLRPYSETFNKVFSLTLGEESAFKGLVIPAGCAHGYITLEPNSDFIYFMDKSYSPELTRGVRWNDPQFSINWPTEPIIISDQDSNWPLR